MTSADDIRPEDLERSITELFQGPLDSFVARRDALAKELKTADRGADSASVKRLRKPSRLAWALDAAVLAEPSSVDQVASAVNAVGDAQAGRGDMREATRRLREAVQAAAGVAAGAAADAGLPVQRSALVPALMAVVADRNGFRELQLGQLAEIPTGGGLDALTDPPLLAVSDAEPRRPTLVAVPEPTDRAALARARAAVEEAEAAVVVARDQAADAAQALDAATTRTDAADQALQRAETEARAAGDQLRQAKREAKVTRDQTRKAEQTATVARGRLDRLSGPG